MKARISVTLDQEVVSMLNSLIQNRKYRNRSHAVEYAIEQLTKDENTHKADRKRKNT